MVHQKDPTARPQNLNLCRIYFRAELETLVFALSARKQSKEIRKICGRADYFVESFTPGLNPGLPTCHPFNPRPMVLGAGGEELHSGPNQGKNDILLAFFLAPEERPLGRKSYPHIPDRPATKFKSLSNLFPGGT